MRYSERKQAAVANVQARLDKRRLDQEWDDEENVERTLNDDAETARHLEADPMSELAGTSPGHRRAVASVREILREREEMSDEDELAAAFGDVDGGAQDDEDDGVAGDIWG